MSEHLINALTPDGVWLLGTIDRYVFEAKVCDEDSVFGIDDGRVIKLFVYNKHRGQELISYEWGWDKYPQKAEDEDVLDALLLFCSSLPKQDIRKQTMRKERAFLITDGKVLEWESDSPS